MAYLVPISKPKCQACDALATERLFNWVNAEIGTYCRRHAPAALKAQQDSEARNLPGVAYPAAPKGD